MALHRMQLDRYSPSSMRSVLRRKQHLFAVSIKTLTHPARPSLLSPSSAAPGMIYGDKLDMIDTICYIVDVLAFQNPSSSAVAEEGDGFAHLFSRATPTVVVKALAKLGAAFDAMVTRHEGEHKLLGSYGQGIMGPRERIYQDKVSARWREINQSGARNGSSGNILRLQSGDIGFLDWNTAMQDFRGEVTRAMEDAHMPQGAIDLVVSKLPI
ncbi:hypothetical protein NCS56_01259500 [Fusarium sp. Ph1]|nr:hypothetical protein NCS56_01259500 [Fusarium sp. Ph1]